MGLNLFIFAKILNMKFEADTIRDESWYFNLFFVLITDQKLDFENYLAFDTLSNKKEEF